MSPSERPEERPRAAAEPIREPRVGRVLGLAGPGCVRVDFPGNPSGGPLLARVAAPLDEQVLREAVQTQQGAVLLFEEGDPQRPLLLTLLAPTQATPVLDALLEPGPEERPREARVDGRRVVIEGREEVVLRCGRASITLSRDGRVELRGVQVVSDAEERQRIRGRIVDIN